MADLTRTALAIDSGLLAQFDQWMARHGYDNRSQALRDIIRQTLVKEEWDDPEADVVAALSVIYDHSQATAGNLTQMQHEDHHAILCSQHVHLDHHRCLEVILMQGKAGQLRRLADSTIATKGVKTGELTMMSKKV